MQEILLPVAPEYTDIYNIVKSAYEKRIFNDEEKRRRAIEAESLSSPYELPFLEESERLSRDQIFNTMTDIKNIYKYAQKRQRRED